MANRQLPAHVRLLRPVRGARGGHRPGHLGADPARTLEGIAVRADGSTFPVRGPCRGHDARRRGRGRLVRGGHHRAQGGRGRTRPLQARPGAHGQGAHRRADDGQPPPAGGDGDAHPVPLEHVARAAHAAQLGDRVLRSAAAGHVGAADGRSASSARDHLRGRTTPHGHDRRRAGRVADRGRQGGADLGAVRGRHGAQGARGLDAPGRRAARASSSVWSLPDTPSAGRLRPAQVRADRHEVCSTTRSSSRDAGHVELRLELGERGHRPCPRARHRVRHPATTRCLMSSRSSAR